MAHDVIIIGARCAGAATAALLARRGRSVLVVDRSARGRDTLSTHALMRGAVLQLHRWGVLDRVIEDGTPPIWTTSFHYGSETVEIPIKPKDGIDALYAPRRTVLDPILVDAARAAGADVRFGLRLEALQRDGEGRVVGIIASDDGGAEVRAEAPIIVGADGARSTVASLVGASSYRTARHTTTLLYGYWSGLEPDGYHWYYGPGVSAGVIPTSGGLTCIFVAMPPGRLSAAGDVQRCYARVLEEAAPRLVKGRLCRAVRVGGLRRFGGHLGFFRQSFGDGWALVGDAGYFKDPLTAHGITDALRDAELLANALDQGEPLHRYQARRDALAIPFFEATDAVASLAWDMGSLKRNHLALSKAMTAEVEAVRELDRAPCRAA